MKKLIIAGLAAVIAYGAFAQQNIPAFDEPKASVIAVSSAALPGKMKDNIKLINLSTKLFASAYTSTIRKKHRGNSTAKQCSKNFTTEIPSIPILKAR